MSVFIPLALTPALWAPYGWRCADIRPDLIEMRCTSGALLGPPMRGPARIDALVWLEPAADGRGFASITINGDVPGDRQYASAALVAKIAPFWDVEQPHGALLAEQAAYAEGYTTGPASPGWHQLSISYADGLAVACVDGICQQAQIDLGEEYQPELVCVGVDPGQPGENSATCRFTAITIAAPALAA